MNNSTLLFLMVFMLVISFIIFPPVNDIFAAASGIILAIFIVGANICDTIEKIKK